MSYADPVTDTMQAFPEDLTGDIATAIAALQQELEAPPVGQGGEDLERMLDCLLTWARRLVHADGGSVYLRYGAHLRLVVAQSDLLERRWGGAELRSRFRGLTLRVDSTSIVGYVARTGEVVDVPDMSRPGPDRAWEFCPAVGGETYVYGALLTVPIRTASGEIRGVLQLINPTDAQGRPVPFASGAEATAARFARRAGHLIRRRDAPTATQPADLVEELVAPSEAPEPPATPPASEADTRGLTRVRSILIADDEPAVREVLTRILRDADPLHTVETVANGVEALSAVFWRRPHLALLDINMPVMNGLDVLRQIRTVDPKLPVILMSGSVSEEAMAAAIKYGVLAVVPKPFEMKQILTLVSAALI
jgi:CheY-like chemotaxis protein